MRNSGLFKLAAPSLLLLLGSCMLEEPDATNPERSFAPRILEAPPCNQIRLEVAQFDLDGWSGTNPNGSFMRTTTVQYSAGRIKMDGLPSDRTLYFRVSGLDIQGSAIWTIPGGVPTEGGSPSVSIGYGTPYYPRTIAMPNIGWTTDQLFPQIECWTSSWPAWTTDGSLPGPQNPSTTAFKNGMTTSVQLSPGQELTARCTDGTLWSPDNTYDAPSAIPVPGTSLPAPDLYTYSSGSSYINASVNQAGYGFSTWKVVYRFGTGGEWNVSDFVPIPFSGSGIFQAYAIASNNLIDWVAGPVAEIVYPDPAPIGPGTAFVAPKLSLPSSSSGYASLQFDPSGYTGFSHWRIAVQNSQNGNTGTWSIYRLPFNEWLTGSGTFSAYIMAWNGSSWVSGEMTTSSYPAAAPEPTADGPGTDLDLVTINVPSTLGGPLSFTNPYPSSSYERWMIAFKTSEMPDWMLASLDTTIAPSTSGSIQAYLVAWSPSRWKWAYGALASASYPDTIPNPTLIPSTGPLPSVDITTPSELPGKATFRSSYIMSGYVKWMVACRRSDMADFTIIPIDSFLPITVNTTIYAYLMAWNTTTKTWQSGPQNMVNVTSGQSVLNPILVAPGSLLPKPSVRGLSFLPSSITFRTNASATDSVSYSDWKVAYKVVGYTDWNLIDASQSAYIPYSGNPTVVAYLEAWDRNASKWVAGPETTQVLPIVVNVDPPVIKDTLGNILGTTWEREGLTIALDMQAKGTIYFSTSGNDPDSTTSWTEKWTPGKILTFPATTENLPIRAIAVVDGNASQVTQVVAKRPSWAQKDNKAAGCVDGNGSQVFACGDERGPWYWSPGSGWAVVDPNWTHGAPTTIRVTDFDLFVATASGEVYWAELARISEGFVQMGSSLGKIGGLEYHSDTLWATTSAGPFFFNVDLLVLDWSLPPDLQLPFPDAGSQPGPVWSDGENLWMAFGSDLWRHGPTTALVPAPWTRWLYTSSSLTWIGADPFATAGVAYGNGYGLSPVPLQPNGSVPYNISSGKPVVEVVAIRGAAYVATDNSGGLGAVSRIGGWSASSLYPNRGWPLSGSEGVASQGMAKFSHNGLTWILASSLQGTYVIRVFE